MGDYGGWDFGGDFDLFGGAGGDSVLAPQDFGGSFGGLDLGGGSADFGGIASGLDLGGGAGGSLGGLSGGTGGAGSAVPFGAAPPEGMGAGGIGTASGMMGAPAAPQQPGPGFMDTLGGIARNVLPVAQLGVAGMGMYNAYGAGQQNAEMGRLARGAATRLGDNATQQQQISGVAQGQSGSLSQWSQDELARAARGEVPPAIQTNIDQWKVGALQQINDRFARQGLGSSTQIGQWRNWVEQQAEAMKGKYLMDMRQQGIGAAGTAGQVLGVGSNALQGAGNSLGQSGQIAGQQQQGLEGLIGAANNVLARLNAMAGQGQG